MKPAHPHRNNPALVFALLALLVMGSLMAAHYPQHASKRERNLSATSGGFFATISARWLDPRQATAKEKKPQTRPTTKLPARTSKKPTTASVNKAAKKPAITVSKQSVTYKFNPKAPKTAWKFLTKSVRQKVDGIKLRKGRWRTMVIHSSATTSGSAKSFDYYHRKVKKMDNGLAYHFVIGNGNGSGDGQIEVGPRWTNQQAGGHLRSAAQNEIAIGICLVGDFENNKVSLRQLEALDELIDYLHAKLGKIHVTTHKRINVRPTLCPGRYFPESMFVP